LTCAAYWQPMADGQGSNPHDRLFRFAFQDLDIARDEIRAVLPPEVVSQLRLDELSIEREHLPEPDLSERFCDVLYRVPSVDGADEFVWLLLEHQSTDAPLMAFRLLEYMVRIWGRLVRATSGLRRLPVLIPVVLTHDPSGWAAPVRFHDLIPAPPQLRTHVPTFEYKLDDLTRLEPSDLARRSDRAAFRLVLWALQCRGRVQPSEADAWRDAFRLLVREERWRDMAQAILAYVTRLDEADDPVAFRAARAANSEMETVVTSYAEKMIEQGRTEGRTEGEAEMLRRLLRMKFGELDVGTLNRIQAATSEQLLRWAELVLTAESVDGVFGDPTP
jgi:predicted transposase/invertase (TIGR01784 family)